ncbi:V-type ATP synthase subunit I [Acidobacteriota bacterium]
MAIAEVQKVEILAHAGVKMEFLSSLQEEGLVQIEGTNFEELELTVSIPDVTNIDHTLFRLSQSLEYLSRWEGKGSLKKLFGQKPQLSWQKRKEILRFDYTSLLDQVEKLESEKNGLISEIRVLEKDLEFFEPLKELDLPVKSVKSTDFTEVILGILPKSRHEDLKRLSDEENLWYQVIRQGKRNVHVLIVFLSKEKDRLEHLIKELDFAFLYLEPMFDRVEDQDKVNDVMEKINRQIEAKGQELEVLEKKSRKLADSREKLMIIYDVLHNEREKLLSSRLLGETERVFYLEGWARSSDRKKIESKIKSCDELVECYFRDPLPDEEPPVILENPGIAKPFEIVTKLYGLPQHGTLDPTLALMPFFFIFVGLTVSEAGYGLLVALLSFLVIKLAKPKGGLRQFLYLLLILGVSNVILGTMVGGWFGFPFRKLLILDPLKDPVSFLMLSLALGFIQVWFGTLLNLISGIKKKNYLQAIFVQGGWLLLLPSLVLYLLYKQSIWGILSLVGASGIVLFAAPSRNPIARFFGGLYSLYDISRYLADVLSYSRLLALGLATTVIAMVVNTLCQTALGIPWVGWLIAALIFIGGHLFNLGISFLGGFVHSMRLQFVEFFSKFFQSGGKPFKPLELESKYVDFI